MERRQEARRTGAGTAGARLPRATHGLLAPFCTVVLCGCAGSTFTVIEENDVFSLSGNTDEHYTQGLRASWIFPTEQAPLLVRKVVDAAPVPTATTEAIGLFVGQEMYTPTNIRARRLLRDDRPYAGWLYGGIVVANVVRTEDGREGDTLDSYELQLGVVGSSSLADVTQKRWHELIDADRPRGWRNQLDDEPGVVVSWEHRRRLLHGWGEEFAQFDAIGGPGVSVGNVFTNGRAELLLRVGDLPRDFGVNTIHSSVAEVGAPEDELDGLKWYVFAAGEARGVVRNIFLDGNTSGDSHDVDKEHGVYEGAAGVALHWGNWRVTFSQNVRSSEFDGQHGSQDFGSVSLTYQCDF